MSSSWFPPTKSIPRELRMIDGWRVATMSALWPASCMNAARKCKGGSLLDESTAHLIGDRLEQIAHHRPASCLHENLGRHPRHELLTGKSPAFLVRQDNSHREVRRVGLLVTARVGRDI